MSAPLDACASCGDLGLTCLACCIAGLNLSHGQPAHYGGLCDEPHYCPSCEDQTGQSCADLFQHPICGLVACCSDEDGE